MPDRPGILAGVQATRLLAFAAVAAVLIAVPGPSVLFVVSRALALGRQAALRTVGGNAAGEFVQVLAVAAGVGTIIQRSVMAFTVIKLVGAAVLVALGFRTIRRRRRLAAELASPPSAGPPPRHRRVLGEGFMVGVSNPKTVVFFVAILPQFADRAAGRVPLQLLVLGLVWVAIALVSDSCWALAAGAARPWLARTSRRAHALGGASGVVMIGLGVGLGLTARRG